MSESLGTLIDRLRPSKVIERRETGHVTVLAPLTHSEIAATDGGLYTRLSGRYVQAGKPNHNGAFWTTDALAFGLPSVAGGPVNFLHDERSVLGCITGSRLVREQAAANYGDHIAVDMILWRWMKPSLVQRVETAAESDSLYLSMECISDSITCLSDPESGREGCGRTFAAQNPCDHIRGRTSMRRFDRPVFLGGGLIVPPIAPGWKDAKVEKAGVSRVDDLSDVRYEPDLLEAAERDGVA